MEKTAKVFAANLCARREAKGWTQEALAERLGVSTQTIRNYEGQRRWPDPEMMEQIASALDMQPWELIRPEGAAATALKPLGPLAALNTYFTGAPMEKPKPIELAVDLDRAQKEIQRLTEKVQELETLLSQGHHMASRIARLGADERTKILDDLALLDAGKAISPIREGLKPPSSSAVKKPR